MAETFRLRIYLINCPHLAGKNLFQVSIWESIKGTPECQAATPPEIRPSYGESWSYHRPLTIPQ